MQIYELTYHKRKDHIGSLTHKLQDRRLERVQKLDRAADAELSLGRHGQAERLAHQAAELRECSR